MKTRLIYVMLLAIWCAAAGTVPARAQLATVSGKVTDNDKPLPGVHVTYTSKNNGRQIKLKTDKKGEFYSIGVPPDTYHVTVVDESGKELFSNDKVVGAGGDNAANTLNIDISKGTGATAGNAGGADSQSSAGGSGKSSGQTKVTKEELERIKAENAKATSLNALISQAQTSLNAKNWAEAEPVLKQMIAADPNRWQFYQALGNAQLNQGEFDDAVASFDKGIQLAQPYASGSTPKDPKNPDTDPAKAKAGVGAMYALQGNAYLKLKKNPEALAAFTKAAEMDPNPAVAYFNICATQYNTGNMEGAVVACDKAIQADPTKADAYFIKGSSLYGNGKLDANNKYVVPAGTTDALNKYLQLAPDGPHAADVKLMLQALGEPITTSYGKKKK